METIRNYLDNMFQGVPQTPAVERLRDEIYANMEEKYDELKRNGKSEHEAIGIVISEFGNIDELLGEFGITRESAGPKSQSEDDSQLPVLTLEQANNYLSIIKKTSKLAAFGVFLILFGVSLMFGYIGFMEQLGLDSQLTDVLPIVQLLILVSVAVGIFIFVDHQRADYKFIEKGDFQMMDSVRIIMEKELRDYRSKNLISTITGVCMCIIAPAVLIAGSLFDDESMYPMSVMMFIIAVAVFLFIAFGELTTSYQKLLKTEEYTPEAQKQNKLTGLVASVVFPLAAGIFLIWGFVYGDWTICWIVFPVTGILYAIFCAVYEKSGS